jgi:hypothetical protein
MSGSGQGWGKRVVKAREVDAEIEYMYTGALAAHIQVEVCEALALPRRAVSTLSHLRSKCTNRLECRYAMPRATSSAHCTRTLVGG